MSVDPPKKSSRLTSQDFGRLDDIQKMYMRRVEKQNVKRANETLASKARHRWIGGFFGVSVLAIYFYTIYAIKQESFGEEFDKRITDKSSR